MRHSIRRSIAIPFAVVSAPRSRCPSGLFRRRKPPGAVNCVNQTHIGAACQGVRVGQRRRVRLKRFPQTGTPVSPIPAAKEQNFVIAPQTGTPQGFIPPIHDHTIQAAPGDPGWTPFMHVYFVICSPEGLTSGDCVAILPQALPGGGTLSLAKSVNGEPLTSAATIGVQALAGLLMGRYGCGDNGDSQPCEVIKRYLHFGRADRPLHKVKANGISQTGRLFSLRLDPAREELGPAARLAPVKGQGQTACASVMRARARPLNTSSSCWRRSGRGGCHERISGYITQPVHQIRTCADRGGAWRASKG